MQVFDKTKLDQKFTVLYVEDQLDIQEEFVEILALYVDTIVVASNGEEGVLKYFDTLPDIIITDIQMPIMNGLEMIEKIRSVDEETPIIVTSAFNDNKYLLDAINLNVEYYVLKPVKVAQLERHLEKIKKSILQKRELQAYHLYLEERVDEEMRLKEAKESLLIRQNKAAEIGQMVGIIAHQWKQPLHYLHLLIEDLGLEHSLNTLNEAYIKEFIEKGVARIDFLSQTMDNFLSFYKNESTQREFDVEKVIQETTDFLTLPLKALGIEVRVTIERSFKLKGICNELQQVILNLINNAKEAFADKRKADASIKVRCYVEDDRGKIEVRDNAGGIPEAILEDIFQMEYTTKAEGNGIGLHLVQKIVKQRFNGYINVQNSDGGVCFTLCFDLK